MRNCFDFCLSHLLYHNVQRVSLYFAIHSRGAIHYLGSLNDTDRHWMESKSTEMHGKYLKSSILFIFNLLSMHFSTFYHLSILFSVCPYFFRFPYINSPLAFISYLVLISFDFCATSFFVNRWIYWLFFDVFDTFALFFHIFEIFISWAFPNTAILQLNLILFFSSSFVSKPFLFTAAFKFIENTFAHLIQTKTVPKTKIFNA